MNTGKNMKKLTAFLLTAVILVQSGITALASEHVPEAGKTAGSVEPAEGSAEKQAEASMKMQEGTSVENPSENSTENPEDSFSETPENTPSEIPEGKPSEAPTETPSEIPEESPSEAPTETPSWIPAITPSEAPTESPSGIPETSPSEVPTEMPAGNPSETPIVLPSATPSVTPEIDATPSASAAEQAESRLDEANPVEKLSDKRIAELKSELIKESKLAQESELISPDIVIEDDRIIFSGEMKEDVVYCLAFRINPDREHFTEDGTIRVAYEDEEAEEGEIYYDSPEDTWEKGFWEVVIPMPESSKLTVTVDNDGEDSYQPGRYEIELSGMCAAGVESEAVEEASELPGVANSETVISLKAPAIKSAATKDIAAVIKFTPSDEILSVSGEAEESGERRYYTLVLTDKITGKALNGVNITNGDGEGEFDYRYRFLIGSDSTETKPLYTCEVEGLLSNKAYIAQIIAHYKPSEGEEMEKGSNKLTFTTKKEMLATGGSLETRIVAMETLQKEPDNSGSAVNYETGVSVECNKSYALMAEVSNLSRALETEKLSWTVLTDGRKAADKNSASIKVSASTFEAQLEIKKEGSYVVKAVSSVTKEELAVFVVNAAPQADGESAGGVSFQSELFYFYDEDRESYMPV